VSLRTARRCRIGVGDDDIELAVGANGFVHGVLQIAVAGDVRGNDERTLVASGGDSPREGVE
jgi:hypothetical protein